MVDLIDNVYSSVDFEPSVEDVEIARALQIHAVKINLRELDEISIRTAIKIAKRGTEKELFRNIFLSNLFDRVIFRIWVSSDYVSEKASVLAEISKEKYGVKGYVNCRSITNCLKPNAPKAEIDSLSYHVQKVLRALELLEFVSISGEQGRGGKLIEAKRNLNTYMKASATFSLKILRPKVKESKVDGDSK